VSKNLGPARREQDATDPYNADLGEILMSPVMTALLEIAKVRRDLAGILDALDANALVDLSLLGLAEGQSTAHVITAQGRPYSWRTQLFRILKRDRNIDPSMRGWRNRTRDMPEEKLPAYLSDKRLAELRSLVDALTAQIDTMHALRAKDYPATDDRLRPILGEAAAEAS
jgi:hypothetical protein